MDRDEALRTLGIETTADRFVTGLLIGLGAGALIGGALALLFAPKTGEELREELTTRGREVTDRIKSRVGRTGEPPVPESPGTL